MARPIRVEFPGAVYHVTARGDGRHLTFRDDADRRQFLATLEQAAAEHGLRVHGFCLLPNHYHLLVESPRANLSRAIGWLQTTYTIRFNQRHRRSGHLFHGRFKAHLVEADRYATELLRYLHLNPVRPRDKRSPVPITGRALLAQYSWSSHRAYLGTVAAPAWLCTDWLSFFARRSKDARRQYRQFVGEAFGATLASPWEHLQGSLVLGSDGFLDQVSRLLEGKGGAAKVRWASRMEDSEKRQSTARTLARREPRRNWQVWLRVTLGGERRVDVARDHGYRDGSAITQILKRLQKAAQTTPTLQKRMQSLRTHFSKLSSSVKR